MHYHTNDLRKLSHQSRPQEMQRKHVAQPHSPDTVQKSCLHLSLSRFNDHDHDAHSHPCPAVAVLRPFPAVADHRNVTTYFQELTSKDSSKLSHSAQRQCIRRMTKTTMPIATHAPLIEGKITFSSTSDNDQHQVCPIGWPPNLLSNGCHHIV